MPFFSLVTHFTCQGTSLQNIFLNFFHAYLCTHVDIGVEASKMKCFIPLPSKIRHVFIVFIYQKMATFANYANKTPDACLNL